MAGGHTEDDWRPRLPLPLSGKVSRYREGAILVDGTLLEKVLHPSSPARVLGVSQAFEKLIVSVHHLPPSKVSVLRWMS